MASSRKKNGTSTAKRRPEPVETRPRAVVSLRLTTAEAVHLRDLFGIVLPPDGSRTVSQSLAAGTGRPFVESQLWQKVQKVCTELGVPLGDEAPDFVVVPTAVPMPELAVQRFDAVDQQDAGSAGADVGLDVVFDSPGKDEPTVVAAPSKTRKGGA